MDVAVGRAKQVVLLDHIAIDEGIAERVAHCRRDARQQLGAVLVVPPRGEVEPQRVDVTVGGAKQVVLLKQAAFFVDEGVAERIDHCGGDARQQHGAILVVPPRGEVEPQRVDVAVGRAKQVVLLDHRATDEGIAKRVAHCGGSSCRKGHIHA